MQTAKFDHDHGHACRDCYGVRSASSSAVEESAASGQEQNIGTGTIGVVEIRQLDQHPVGSRFERGTPGQLRAVSKILWPPRRFRANELRVSVEDCGSPVPLCVARLPAEKAAEGCRSPKLRGIIQPAFRCGHSFCYAAIAGGFNSLAPELGAMLTRLQHILSEMG